MPSRIVVFDTETTGLGRFDRVVEIAAITMDPRTGEIIDEFETLINPERDIGPTSIHGITASMVETAPTFAEIAVALGRRITGAVLVGHNLSFDAKMLKQEYDRLNISFEPGNGYCTLRATGLKLASACTKFGVSIFETHQAYSDALATALLLQQIDADISGCTVGRVATRGLPHIPRTTRRRDGDGLDRSRVSHVADVGNLSFLVDAELVYLDALDHVLDDHVLSVSELQQMNELADYFGLTENETDDLHRKYVNLVLDAAPRDGNISLSEHELLTTLCRSLGLNDVHLPDPTNHPTDGHLPANGVICFTGEAVVNGRSITRPEIEAVAVRNGFSPVSNVTRDCQLLVASDLASMSGKARQARRNQVPIMGVMEFISRCRVKPVAM